MEKLISAFPDAAPPPVWDDVRFIGAVAGRYVLSGSQQPAEGGASVYACRLCSISTRLAVVVAPVIGKAGEGITAHFEAFGIVRGRILRRTSSGFAIDLDISEEERPRLAGKIRWHKMRVLNQLSDRREHKRTPPRDPRSTLTLADGTLYPCFLVDISCSGASISAAITPPLGTPLAIGKIVGRVVRLLEVGFAVQFIAVQEPDTLEAQLAPLEPGAE